MLFFSPTDDETIEEEVVSDGELPHKKSKKTVVSPTSSLSPTQPDMQTDDHNTATFATISQNGSSTHSTMQATITGPLSSGN